MDKTTDRQADLYVGRRWTDYAPQQRTTRAVCGSSIIVVEASVTAAITKDVRRRRSTGHIQTVLLIKVFGARDPCLYQRYWSAKW